MQTSQEHGRARVAVAVAILVRLVEDSCVMYQENQT